MRNGKHIATTFALLVMLTDAAAAQPAGGSSVAAELEAISPTVRILPGPALAKLRALEQSARAAGASERRKYLGLVARANSHTGNIPLAREALKELMADVAHDTSGDDYTAALLVSTLVGIDKNDPQDDVKTITLAYSRAAKSKNVTLQVDVALAYSLMKRNAGDYPASLKVSLDAIDMAEQHGLRDQFLIASQGLADLYDFMGEYELGFKVLNKALKEATETQNFMHLAVLKISQYALFASTKKPDQALLALVDAHALAKTIGAKEVQAVVAVNLSGIYLERKQFSLASSYASEALRLARKLGIPRLESAALLSLGEYQMHAGQREQARANFDKAFAYMDKEHDKPALRDVLVDYADTLEEVGDLAGALKAIKRERALTRELFDSERKKAVWELQQKYASSEQEKRIAALDKSNAVKEAKIEAQRVRQQLWWLVTAIALGFAAALGICYRKLRSTYHLLELKSDALHQQGQRDPLTGLYNRRHFHEFMCDTGEIDQRQSPAPDSVSLLMMLDIDHFKLVNDRYGHAAGDAVLKRVADRLAAALRETDMIVRWGGEEFLAYLPSVPRSDVDDITRRVLNGISGETVWDHGHPIVVSASVGYLTLPTSQDLPDLTWEHAIVLTDLAMYHAKTHGRNRAYGLSAVRLGDVSLDDIEEDLAMAADQGHLELALIVGDGATSRNGDDAIAPGSPEVAVPGAMQGLQRCVA